MTQPPGTRARPEQKPAQKGPQKPTPPPLKTNDLATIGTGMALWLVAIGVLYGLRASGAADIAMWWIWACVAGFVLGFYGVYFIWKRQRHVRG